MASMLRSHFWASYTVQMTAGDENNMFINTCWHLLLFLNWQSTKPGHAEDKFEINFWGCIALKAEERTAKRFEHDPAAAPSAYISDPKMNSLASSASVPALYANCSGSSVGSTAKRMNDFSIFFRFFVLSDARGTEAEIIKLFGSRLFGIGIIADIFQRQGTKCEAWKGCPRAPLWSAQNFKLLPAVPSGPGHFT